MLGRIGQGLSRRLKALVKQFTDVAGSLLCPAQQFGPEILQHGGQGASHGLRHRCPGLLRAPRTGLGQATCVDQPVLTHALAKALEILGHDGAGIAPRSVQSTFCDDVNGLGQSQLGMIAQRVENGLEGKCQVGAGITVRHGKNIDAVEIVATQKQVAYTRAQRAGQPWSVQVCNGNCGSH